MPNKKNVTNLKSLRKAFSEAGAAIFVDYSALTSNQITELRSKLQEAAAKLMIAKNTLINIALGGDKENKKIDLKGQTGVIFALEDNIQPIKTLFEFINENDLPKVKLGILEGEYISKEKVEEISKIPSKPHLLARFMSSLRSPIYGFSYAIGESRSKFTRVINQIAESGKQKS